MADLRFEPASSSAQSAPHVTPSGVALPAALAPAEHRPAGARRRARLLLRVLLVHGDVFALLASFFVAQRLTGTDAADGVTRTGLAFILTIPVWVVAAKAISLYDRDDDLINHSTVDELPAIFRLVTIGTWLFFALAWAVSEPDSVGHAVLFWLLALALVPTTRAALRPAVRRDPAYLQNTVIVGAGTVGQLLGRKLLKHPDYGLKLVGFVDGAPKERRDDLDDLTILGAPADLPYLVEVLSLDRVIIAFSNDSHEETMELIRLLKDRNVRIDVVPRLFDIIPPRLASQTIEGIPLISLPRLRLSPWSRFLKRMLDVAVSAIAIVLLFPVMLLTAVLIKLDSRGPVYFRQLRMGHGGRPFHIYKFRTMAVDADEQKHLFAHLNVHADPRMFKAVPDPRVTGMGGVLRRFSLDELPQLFNVLKGQMSLIGPRPLVIDEDRHIDAWGRRRLSLKPGMTGLWQVSGRSAIPFDEMVKLDYLYVTTWSLANDCKLLLQTVPLVLKGERPGAS